LIHVYILLVVGCIFPWRQCWRCTRWSP